MKVEYKGPESIYNRLASVYNKCSNGMEGLERILNIRDGLEGFRDSLKKSYFEKEIRKVLLLHIYNGIDDNKRREHELSKINKYTDQIFDEVSAAFFPWGESTENEDNFPLELKEDLEFQFDLLQEQLIDPEGNKKTLADLVIEIFQIGKDSIEAYHLAGTEITVMEALLIPDIINNNYPKTLKYDRDKGSRLLERVNEKRGRPLANKVPQNEVEEVVAQMLEEYKNEGRLVKSLNKGKKVFSIIHKNGPKKGLANVNQIFKYFEDVHPDLINISMRQFKKRIKKALPKEMK